MSSASRKTTPPRKLPELNNGDHMSQKEFHRRYEQMPENFRAELIGGIVYVASPLKLPHGRHHYYLVNLFCTYEMSTPGVEGGDNATILLGPDAEPQPDVFLRILPECGGRARTTPDDYVEGPPELVAEVALSSHAIDLYEKRQDYARGGVLEYLVLCVRDRQLRWFDLRADRELNSDADGIIRVRSFPGLWIDVAALLGRNRRMIKVLEQGLASAEPAAFVRRLAEAKAAGRGKGKPVTKRKRRR